MDSLVIELQRNALDPAVTVSDLLRKALVVAIKLNVVDFQTWITNELNGYTDQSTIPSYRRLTGEVKGFNPYQGWVPIVFEDRVIAQKMVERSTNQPVSELEAIVNQVKGGAILTIPLPDDLARDVMNDIPVRSPSLHIPRARVSAILDIVRNTVLNWALQLEKDGILGQELSFSQKEKVIAEHTVYNVANYFGNISHSQIQQSPTQSTQVMNIQEAGAPEIQNLLKELEAAVDAMTTALPSDTAEGARRDFDVLAAEVTSKNPRKQWYQLSVDGLKKAAKDAREIGIPVIELAGRILSLLNSANPGG